MKNLLRRLRTRILEYFIQRSDNYIVHHALTGVSKKRIGLVALAVIIASYILFFYITVHLLDLRQPPVKDDDELFVNLPESPQDSEETNLEEEIASGEDAEVKVELEDPLLVSLENDVRELRYQIRVTEETNKGMQELVTALMDEVANLQDELQFYHSIFKPKQQNQGVKVYSLNIRKSENKDQYAFRVTLTQNANANRVFRGNMKMILEVAKGSGVSSASSMKKRILNVESIGTKSNKLAFKFFQAVTGSFQLPPNDVPLRLKISITPRSKRGVVAERWFDWGEVYQG